MKKIIVICAICAFATAAHAQVPSAENDLAMSIQSVEIAATQLQSAGQRFAVELKQLQQQKALADYWHDACISTPGCGKPHDPPH